MENGLDENSNKNDIVNSTFYFSRLLMLASLFFIGNIISILGGMKAASLIYHIDLNQNNMVDFLTHPSHTDAVIFIQNLYLFLAFGLPALVFLQFHAKQDMYYFMGIAKINKPLITYTSIIIGALCLVPLIDVLAELNHMIPGLETSVERQKNIDSMLNIFLSGTTGSDLILNILIVGLLPAICEELFFRAAIQNIIKDWTKKPYLAIAITAVIFSLIHGDLSGFIPRIGAGVFLGLVYFYTKNIGISILFHFIYNSFTVVTKWLMNNEILKIKDDYQWPIYITIISTLFLIGSIYLVRQNNTNNQNAII
ncbi:MAG: CPBP family intramembrane metalloprotease [Bacteroidetes bacterium]|nr:CPBP family intramembrane metalloprotease [Bacteroidota bacterium]